MSFEVETHQSNYSNIILNLVLESGGVIQILVPTAQIDMRREMVELYGFASTKSVCKVPGKQSVEVTVDLTNQSLGELVQGLSLLSIPVPQAGSSHRKIVVDLSGSKEPVNRKYNFEDYNDGSDSAFEDL